jgi:putative isomerase
MKSIQVRSHKAMNRRQFLAASMGAGITAMLAGPGIGSGLGAAEPAGGNLEALFESDDPKLIRMAADVMRNCVLAKIKPPEGTAKRRWLQAGTGDAFYGQWIWDTMFMVDLLAILPEHKETLRDVFQNYWDFQERWNTRFPAYAHNMVATMIEPRGNTKPWYEYPALSQIPILGWGLERVYQRNGDKELLRQSLVPLEKFHEWYWRERDVTESGLIAVGAYCDEVGLARCESFDNECCLDDLKLTRHPKRQDAAPWPWVGEGRWYGDICLPGNTSYLIQSERSLARLATILGDTAMADRRRKRIEKCVAAVREHMWDQESGVFLAVKRDTFEKIRIGTIGSWMPLIAEIPTRAMTGRMAEAIKTDHWQTPLPIPTVDRHDKRWVPNSYWRGDVWPAPNYQVAAGFAQQGYRAAAADIADKTVANALVNGINEHYDSVTGKPLGVGNLGMSCAIVTMMLDGLTSKHHLKVRKAA